MGSLFGELLRLSELLFGTADALKGRFFRAVLHCCSELASKLLCRTDLSMVAAGLASVKDARFTRGSRCFSKSSASW